MPGGRIITVALALLPLGALADELRPAPPYYVDAVAAFSLAEALGQSCSEVSVDLQGVWQISRDLLERLQADGFDPSGAEAGMTDPSGAVQMRIDALLDEHGLAPGADEETVCAAARAEMVEGGVLYGYLVEVPR